MRLHGSLPSSIHIKVVRGRAGECGAFVGELRYFRHCRHPPCCRQALGMRRPNLPGDLRMLGLIQLGFQAAAKDCRFRRRLLRGRHLMLGLRRERRGEIHALAVRAEAVLLLDVQVVAPQNVCQEVDHGFLAVGETHQLVVMDGGRHRPRSGPHQRGHERLMIRGTAMRFVLDWHCLLCEFALDCELQLPVVLVDKSSSKDIELVRQDLLEANG
mmetsp:Transcript_113895/g.242952  ORF Transcript_113895/g.242952 Transcript_113895/m.242952 type:complete len:214 (-) Transcript_113895:33-674(-)